jgi:hypothetical protein
MEQMYQALMLHCHYWNWYFPGFLLCIKWFNSKLSWVTEFADANPKANTKKSKRKSEDDFDFAGSFQGKKIHALSSNHSSCYMKSTCYQQISWRKCFKLL